MDGSQGNSSNAPPPFLTKTYDMVDDPLTNSIVSWSHGGCSFVVWNPPDFAQDLLPKYFKHNNFSSFVRQLNTYGFRKVDPDQWEFANEEFIRGQRHLLKNIYRRKPVHSHSIQNQVNPLTETEKQGYEKEIKRLKHDKSLLELELHRHETEKQGFELQIVSLVERLQSMECRQMELVSFLGQLMRKPDFASIHMQQSECQNKKRKLLDGLAAPMLNSESIEKLDSSLKFLENLLYGVNESFGDDMYDFGVKSQPSRVIVRELSSSSADGEPWSPSSFPSSPHSRDIPSSPELPTCINNADLRPESSEFIADLKPATAPVTENVKPSALEMTSPAVLNAGNDLFWQHFLTEEPDKQESGCQKIKRNTDGLTNDTKPESNGRFWWNRNYIDDLTKNLGHIAAAERS